MTTGFAQSIQTRLVRHAHALGVDPNLVLARYAAERLLYRLSCSAYAQQFVLKGALMLVVWLGETIRPTRDADLLGFGAVDGESLREIFAEVCALLRRPASRPPRSSRGRKDGTSSVPESASPLWHALRAAAAG